MFDGYCKYATAKISHKWRFIAGEIIYNWRFSSKLCLITEGYENKPNQFPAS
jgi:hypothetical protein